MAPSCKCAVLVPVASALEPRTGELLRVLAGRGYDVRTLTGSSQVDLARSTLATRALRDGCEATMWIDSDQTFDPDDVDALLASGEPLVAGLYPAKGGGRMVGKLAPGSGRVRMGAGGGVVPMEYVGMGFTLVRRGVYLKIAEGVPECAGGYGGDTVVPFFLPMVARHAGDGCCYLSEDYSFCLRARGCGFEPRADTRIRVGHVGRREYTWDDLEAPERLESLEVETLPTGEVALAVRPTTRRTAVGIGREQLLTEQQSLEQQQAQHRETMARADAVKADAAGKLEAVGGAMQMVQYLLAKLDSTNKGSPVESKEELNNGEGKAADGPGGPAAGEPAAHEAGRG